MTSTKKASPHKSYAQILFPAVQKSRQRPAPALPPSGLRKLLIHKETSNCLFSGQFKKTLDLQGFAGFFTKLSTKLSTGNLDNFEVPEKQASGAQARAVFQAPALLETAR